MCLKLYSHDFRGDSIEEKQLITAPLKFALTNMVHLERFSSDICRDLHPVLDVLRANGVELEHFGFALDTNGLEEETLTSIQAAQPLSATLSLEIHCPNRRSIASLGDPLVVFCCNFQYLITLKIKAYSLDLPTVMVAVIQNLTMLKTLEFSRFIIYTDTDVSLFRRNFSNIQMGRLESVSLFMVQVEGPGALEN